MTAQAIKGERTSTSLQRRQRLLRAHVIGTVAVGTGVAALLFAATPMQGRADFLLVAYTASLAIYLALAGVVEGRRALIDRLFGVLVRSAVGVALIALGAVLVYTTSRGLDALSVGFFTHSMNGVGPRDATGGLYHSIIGTVEQVLIATAISVPTGLLVAIYLTEYGRGALAAGVRTLIDVMVGIPSIVAGLFIYAFWVLGLKQGFSGVGAGMALSILMLPIVVRSSEEMIKLVPLSLREASYALGLPRWKTILRVVLPTASAGITTGVTLAIARVTGETAPLLLTAFGSNSINTNAFHGPQSALPLFVFQQAGSSFDVAVTRAWAGAFTLIVVVLLLTITARLITRRNKLA